MLPRQIEGKGAREVGKPIRGAGGPLCYGKAEGEGIRRVKNYVGGAWTHASTEGGRGGGDTRGRQAYRWGKGEGEGTR